MASKLVTLAALNLDSAGTAQQLSSTSIHVESIIITAATGNTGIIYIGDSNVASNRFALELDAGIAGTIDAPLAKGGSDFIDLAEVYFDGDTTGDDINVSYLQRAGVR
jgi:hypothetical protein